MTLVMRGWDALLTELPIGFMENNDWSAPNSSSYGLPHAKKPVVRTVRAPMIERRMVSRPTGVVRGDYGVLAA